MFLLTSCCSLPVFLALAGTAIAGTEDDIEEDALNKQLEKRLDDWLEHIKQVFVRPVVLFPVTLDEDKVIDYPSGLGQVKNLNVSLRGNGFDERMMK